MKRPHRVVSDHSFSGGEGLQAGDRKVVDRSIGRRDLGDVGEDVAETADEVEGVVRIAALPGPAQSIQLSPLLPRFETHTVTEGARISRGNPQGELSALPSLVRKDPEAGQEQRQAIDEFLRIRAGSDDPSRYGDVPVALKVGSEKGAHARVARGEGEGWDDLRGRSASAGSAKEIGQDHRSKVEVVPSSEA